MMSLLIWCSWSRIVMMPSFVLLIDKPKGITSHDVVDEVRRVTGERRVGHAGTLDPMATGLLIVLVGREATKRQSEFMGLEKEYEAEITFGAVSDTYDAEGEIVGAIAGEETKPSSRHSGLDLESDRNGRQILKHPPASAYRRSRWRAGVQNDGQCSTLGNWPPGSRDLLENLTEERVEKALGQFLGAIEQRVPPYAAAKIRGKKLYEYARAGRLDEIELPVRKVKVKQFELLYFLPVQDEGLPRAGVRVVCSKGTYIRSLAHDLGQKLGVGAYLSALRRTRIGFYNIENAIDLDSLAVGRLIG